ncbi:MAG: hypothetical protein BEN18_02685 [Epulopiscium sp. Nuni2H_MBin001]|nr:MAG: hypothetical protein BEN18_02685 [Epulopiscium sp. Nuni2H_MBin001]
MGDKRVRATHKAAHGQYRKKGEPFRVGYSQLMYPADGSMGAASQEIIRCRCYLSPVFNDDLFSQKNKVDTSTQQEYNKTVFPDGLSIPDDRKHHIWYGENKFGNPKMPEKTGNGGFLKGGGHGQGALDLMEKHYDILYNRLTTAITFDMTEKQKTKKLEAINDALFNLGFEYVTCSNGVRIGNIFGIRDNPKRIGWGQTWFPASWTEQDIYEAGQYVAKLDDENLFEVDIQPGYMYKYAVYNGICVGIIVDFNKQIIGTIFPDAQFRLTPEAYKLENSYYKKGDRKK